MGFRDYATPHRITKQVIRQWIADQEHLFLSVNVSANLRLLSSVSQTVVDTDLIETPMQDCLVIAKINQ